MYSEIYELRNCGYLKIATISTWNEPFEETLTKLGFNLQIADLGEKTAMYLEENEIDFSIARKIIARILHKDLAYSSKIMEKEKAFQFADEILADNYNTNCIIYTNANWKQAEDEDSIRLSSWNSLTSATFDSGIIIKHPNYCFCIWVEDKD